MKYNKLDVKVLENLLQLFIFLNVYADSWPGCFEIANNLPHCKYTHIKIGKNQFYNLSWMTKYQKKNACD